MLNDEKTIETRLFEKTELHGPVPYTHVLFRLVERIRRTAGAQHHVVMATLSRRQTGTVQQCMGRGGSGGACKTEVGPFGGRSAQVHDADAQDSERPAQGRDRGGGCSSCTVLARRHPCQGRHLVAQMRARPGRISAVQAYAERCRVFCCTSIRQRTQRMRGSLGALGPLAA
jgi:hypothetical protein